MCLHVSRTIIQSTQSCFLVVFFLHHWRRRVKKIENKKKQQNRTFKLMLISKSEGRLSWYWHFARSYPWPVPFYLDLDRELELEERDDERERDEPERLPFFLACLSSSSLASRSYFDRSPSLSSSSSSWRGHVWFFKNINIVTSITIFLNFHLEGSILHPVCTWKGHPLHRLLHLPPPLPLLLLLSFHFL